MVLQRTPIGPCFDAIAHARLSEIGRERDAHSSATSSSTSGKSTVSSAARHEKQRYDVTIKFVATIFDIDFCRLRRLIVAPLLLIDALYE